MQDMERDLSVIERTTLPVRSHVHTHNTHTRHTLALPYTLTCTHTHTNTHTHTHMHTRRPALKWLYNHRHVKQLSPSRPPAYSNPIRAAASLRVGVDSFPPVSCRLTSRRLSLSSPAPNQKVSGVARAGDSSEP